MATKQVESDEDFFETFRNTEHRIQGRRAEMKIRFLVISVVVGNISPLADAVYWTGLYTIQTMSKNESLER
jgi:hypothetical protein